MLGLYYTYGALEQNGEVVQLLMMGLACLMLHIK